MSAPRLECIFCGKELENPKFLPCGHEYCGFPKECLVKLENEYGKVTCPACEDVFLFSAQEYEKMHSEKEEVDRLSRVDLWTKEWCSKHDSAMIWFCHDCQEKICKNCWRADHVKDYHHDVEFLEFVNQKFFLDKMKLFRIEGRKALLEFLIAVIEKILASLQMYVEKFREEQSHLGEAKQAAKELAEKLPNKKDLNYDALFDPNYPEIVNFLKVHCEQGENITKDSCIRRSDCKNLQKIADYLPLLYGKGC